VLARGRRNVAPTVQQEGAVGNRRNDGDIVPYGVICYVVHHLRFDTGLDIISDMTMASLRDIFPLIMVLRT